ncbi:hypothetical protein ACT4S5_08075 [Kocuria oceani]|uniref:hypothetical protein n=1 Tax=Kocuria oceani TaxID=988827 RepID=UPI004035C09A
MTGTAPQPRALLRVSRVLIAVAVCLIGLMASVALYLGLVHAVPLVSWGTDEEELLRVEGAHDVRRASAVAALAGVLLLTARARWTGGIAVAAACLLAVLSHENTIASWGLLLVYVLVLLVGCGTVVGRGGSRRDTGPSRRTRDQQRRGSPSLSSGAGRRPTVSRGDSSRRP